MTASMGSELRLALAMRGGVSLAVWIGGACAEIDKVRRAVPGEESSRFWSRLLSYSGYDRVVVDVIAGASAGGLNGILYATSQVYDFDFSRIRSIWLTVGGIEQLVRRHDEGVTQQQSEDPLARDGQTKGGRDRDRYFPSLLRGDEYFQAQVRTHLRDLVNDALTGEGQPGQPRPDPDVVDLRLSATSVEPIERPVASPADEVLIQRRFASGFHFRHSSLPWERSDFRSGPNATIDDDRLEHLALAARATSSFPGAFEAAFVRSGRPLTFGQPDARDLPDVFLDRRNDGSGFYVSDGGILDNIPLGRALDAIAAAPADSPTTRTLVYLQPGLANRRTNTAGDDRGEGRAEVPMAEATRRSTVAVLTGMAAARIGSETINDDIAQLEAHNSAVLEAVAVRRATFTPIVSAGTRACAELRIQAQNRSSEYRQHRADEDARLIRDLLANPIGTLGRDRFPATVGRVDIGDSRWRSPLAGWSAAARQTLLVTLRRVFAERTGDPLYTGVRGILRVTQLLLEWARYVEGTCEQTARDDRKAADVREQARAAMAAAGDQKARLYRIVAVADAFLERPRRLAWVASVARWTDLRLGELQAIQPDDLDNMARQVQRAVDRLCSVDPQIYDDVRAWLEGTADGSALAAHVDTVTEEIDRVARQELWGAALPPDRTDLRGLLVGQLEVIGGALHALVPVADTAAPASPVTARGDAPVRAGAIVTDEATRMLAEATPGELLHRVLATATISENALEREILTELEILCFAEYAAGLPGRRPVDFVRMSSANATPLAPRFTKLVAKAEEDGLWWDPSKTDPDSQQGIHVNLKLAGNELANFSAFLLEHWRANDWMWGRLDAVPTLVELLVRPEEIRRRFPTAAKAIAAFQPLVAARAPNDKKCGTWEWETQIEAELQELFRLDVDDARCATASIAALRRALVAARQWETLAEELHSTDSSSAPNLEREPTPPTAVLVQDVADYATGAETVRRNQRWPDLVTRFTELGTAASRAVVWNASNNGRVDVDLPPWARRAIIRATPRLAKMAATRLLAPAGSESSPKLKVVASLLVAAAAVLVVLGLVMGAWPFLFGLVIGLGLVGGGIWLGWRKLRALLDPPDPPLPPPSATEPN